MSSDRLFEEFPEISEKQWKQLVQFDLMNENSEEVLNRVTEDGIPIKVFYSSKDLSIPTLAAEQFPLSLYCEKLIVRSQSALDYLLSSLDAEQIQYLDLHYSDDLDFEFLSQLQFPHFISYGGRHLYLQHESVNNEYSVLKFDPIHHLCRHGHWYKGQTWDMSEHLKLFDNGSQTRPFTIHQNLYREAGATVVQSIAYSLAHCSEYLAQLPKDRPLEIWFLCSVGGSYFEEIAALRALRLLANKLIGFYGFPPNSKVKIRTQCSLRNKSSIQAHTNMVRSTIELMASVLGGSDVVMGLPYDVLHNRRNKESSRWARNQFSIIKEESDWAKIHDIPSGSFYIEHLTKAIALKALNKFKNIEAKGGFIRVLKRGNIQKEIETSHLDEQRKFDAGIKKLIGVNCYKKEDIRPANNRSKETYNGSRPLIIAPITEKRLAESLDSVI